MVAQPALAQCAPEPTPANGTVTCSGVDPDGLTVTTYGTTVVVPTGATVLGSGAPAIALRLPSDFYGNRVTLTAAGQIDGGTQDGVSALWQPAANGGFGFTETNVAITVAEGGRIGGAHAVVVGQAASGYGNAFATIDNAGTLAGTSGIALLASTPGYSGFQSITNRATGTIGAISGSVGILSNAGTIDGGAVSAADWGAQTFGPFFGDITNSGSIVSTSDAATLANLSGRQLTNSGTIANRGIGAAIAGDMLRITNAAGGQITSAGATAIRTNSFLTLVNAGTITGDVVTAAAPSYTSNSSIDSSAGTIIGNVRFGAGDDVLVAGYYGTRLVTGVTGTIDGGAGTDTVRVHFAADTTVASALSLPVTFERLSLAPDAQVTATLADGFSAAAPILIGGNGTVVNRTTLSGTTQAVTTSSFVGPLDYPSFVNAGTIRTTAASTGVFAVDMGYDANRFENSGTITAAGAGVAFNSQGTFVNSGTITAAGTAVSRFGPSFDNSGTILSTGGIGANLSGSSGANWVNSGRIEGATIGAQVGSSLVNSGTITSADTGVFLTSYGSLYNRAGGVVTGGRFAISGQETLFNVTIANAGTINGDVNLPGSGTPGDSYNGNRYFALAGGVVNGNLTLASSDTLIADLATAGRFAGVTGTVTGNGAQLRYRVRADATAPLGAQADFSRVGYELYDGAALTLTGTTAQPLTLAGTGSVDLSANITATSGQPAIAVGTILTAPGEAYPAPGTTPAALAITSRGVLTLARADSFGYPYAAVLLGSGDSFTNAGTISVTDAPTVYDMISAITGGESIVNTGSISLGGATGVAFARTLTNSGSIAQVAGARAATGVSNAGTLVNSGTIDVAGNAVQVDYQSMSITNSGRIASSGAAAIAMSANAYSTALKITNLAGGTIAAGQLAIQLAGGAIDNAGTITGSVDLGFSSYGGRTYSSGFYFANGGTLVGDLTFGSGNDTFIALNDTTGVSGTVDGGAGTDLFVHARNGTGTVTFGLPGVVNFEIEGIRALGADTIVTAGATNPVKSDVYLAGDGSIVNTATIDGAVRTGSYSYTDVRGDLLLAAFTNQGSIANGVFGAMTRFGNTGAIGSTDLVGQAVALNGTGDLTFANAGTIVSGGYTAVSMAAYTGSITATNSGSIDGGLSATSGTYDYYASSPVVPHAISLTNSGRIGGTSQAVSLDLNDVHGVGGTIALTNSGVIEASGIGAAAVDLYSTGYYYEAGPTAITVVNSGTIRADGGGAYLFTRGYGPPYHFTQPAVALSASVDSGTLSVTNTASGVISATGERSAALFVNRAALDLTNAGTIRGGAGTALAVDILENVIGTPYLAGAIQTVGDTDDRIVNTGTIIGSIALNGGNDRIENRGTIQGDVFLGAGDDIFLQQASATLIGTVDGGDGTDSLVVDATGGGTITASQFVHFERFSQIGTGDVTYSGAFTFDTIGVTGGSVTVAAGQTLGSAGPVTITGSGANEAVTNNGTIAGSVDMAGGNDLVLNNGTILGAVTLGSGDDQFVEGAGSRVVGTIDGGAGTDLFVHARNITGTVTLGLPGTVNFEREGVRALGAATIVTAGAAAPVKSDVYLSGNGSIVNTATINGAVRTGGIGLVPNRADADAALRLAAFTNQGSIRDGFFGDTRSFTNAGTIGSAALGTTAVTLTASSGSITALNTGTIDGGLSASAAGGTLNVTNAASGVIAATGAGTVAVIGSGAGFSLTNAGTIRGGAGTVLAADGNMAAALGSTYLAGAIQTVGNGDGRIVNTGTIIGSIALGGGNDTIENRGTLQGDVFLGAGDDSFVQQGSATLRGTIDGGAGTDTITVSGGSAAAPVAFTDIVNVERFGMSDGYASIAGSAALGSIDLTGGRLVGLPGSTIGAASITVRQGATFGSAGTVNGNVTVAGTLSPGASPGTMTVNGNVALQAGSVSLFELTPTVSDKLVVNGALSIASGATLQIVPIGTLRPGVSYDLITATGGISGAYTTLLKPDTLFGVLVQRGDSIQLLGQFLGDPRFSPQVTRSIAYANAQIAAVPATSPLFAAIPGLLTASGASNPGAFAQITPEAYASATQIGVDNALTLSAAARGPAFAASGDTAHAFTFAQVLGGWHRLGDDATAGTSATRSNSYGFLGGIGYGDATWSVGAFGGYLNDRQRIDALGAATRADGVVAGVHGRFNTGGFGVNASVLYDGGDARTTRALPAGTNALGRYALHSWVGDVSLGYGMDMPSGWTLRPHAGVTYVRTTRAAVAETGGSAFALNVARDRHVAGFADAGLFFGRTETFAAAFRPFVSLGARYQIQGQRSDALAGYAGGALGLEALEALGARRAAFVGTVEAGTAYRLKSGLDLFAVAASQTGRDDHNESVTAGMRLRF
jgi:hypothetical protein